MKKITLGSITAGLILLPLSALALNFPGTPTGGTSDVKSLINTILNPIWEIFVGLAVIMIIIAAFLFITAQGDAEKVKTARNAAIWAIVGIVVAVLAFSIPTIVTSFVH